MCGIAGFWQAGGLDPEASVILPRMTQALAHRGPDASGHWYDPEAGIALGHRRLSILDLSPAGHQPMLSADGRWVLVYNGEIYNWRELRTQAEAAGARWRGHSDTEVLLAVVEAGGVLAACQRSAGMFAMALWDRERRELHLVRDRVGEKPLYYGWVGRTLLFGSELKSLRAHSAWQGEVDRESLTHFLRLAYVPAPRSIYTGVRKVMPGTIVTIAADGTCREQVYWSLAEIVRRGLASPLAVSDEEAAHLVEARLSATIGEEMVADVPLGAFLSGGIDSTTVVALMQAQSVRPVRTFTVGFHQAEYNEAEVARAVARHLGTDHTELYVTPEAARGVIPDLPAVYDEPFGDSSEIPTMLVARLARQQVTVALSGDGGDECFGGYNRYIFGGRLWRQFARTPVGLRRILAGGIHGLPAATWQLVYDVIRPLIPARLRVAHAGDRLHKFAGVLPVGSRAAMYRNLTSHWIDAERVVRGGHGTDPTLAATAGLPEQLSFVEWMMAADTRTYLPDDILVKVDRAAMHVSLETRVPFVDHRVLELAWRLPVAQKVHGLEGKRVLRRIAERHVPTSLLRRPKTGFAVPIESWLRGPLRDWAESLLAPARIQEEGYFDPAAVATCWSEHISGARNWQYPLWNVLMFQAWHEAAVAPTPITAG